MPKPAKHYWVPGLEESLVALLADLPFTLQVGGVWGEGRGMGCAFCVCVRVCLCVVGGWGGGTGDGKRGTLERDQTRCRGGRGTRVLPESSAALLAGSPAQGVVPHLPLSLPRCSCPPTT